MFAPERQKIRLVQYNVENLFLFLDLWNGQDLKTMNDIEWKKISSSLTPNKPLKKVWKLAEVLRDINADIIMLNEVGGEESLQNFAKHFLNDEYVPFLKEGNSTRGIDVGYLIKRELNVKPILISHKNRPINFLYPHEDQTKAGGKSHYFSRDVAELRLFAQDENSPRLVIMLTHLKSKLDPENIDISGKKRRSAELKTLVDLYNDLRKELGQGTPVVVAGDFNGVAFGPGLEPEFQYLHDNSDLLEVLEVAERPAEDRFSQVQVFNSGKVVPIHIDYIFVSPHLRNNILKDETGVYAYKNELGQRAPLPQSLDDRDQFPSDHYPLVLTLKMPL
jgi:endonuclease/exonuclease/phosphatase family metal-dependent hydrolase